MVYADICGGGETSGAAGSDLLTTSVAAGEQTTYADLGGFEEQDVAGLAM